MPGPTIVWFKRDLRVDDHAPLAEAAARGPVLPVFVVEPTYWALPDSDRTHWEFVRQSLVSLRDRLARRGAPLVVRTGNAVEVLERLRHESGATRLVAHEETGNAWTFARDRAVLRWAADMGVEVVEFPNNGVVRRLRSRDGWAERWNRTMAADLVRPPERLIGTALDPGEIPEWESFLPSAGTLGDRQAGGERAAHETLRSWLAGRGEGYETKLSSPLTAFDACTRLSPHLAFGTISARRVFRDVTKAEGFADRSKRAALSRLRWRDHFIQKLESEPDIEHRDFVRSMEGMRPSGAFPDRLAAWEAGRTGYPMMDACLRCAAATGYLNFRMRAAIVAFASYHLWLDWRETHPIAARWWLDYEPGIHISQFQMQSGTTGINTLRIYNPVKQGYDHDADGAFVRRWVPELRDVSTVFVHEPWLSGSLPNGYPSPIVDPRGAIAQAKETIARYRFTPEALAEADEVQRRHGSRRGSVVARPRLRESVPRLEL